MHKTYAKKSAGLRVLVGTCNWGSHWSSQLPELKTILNWMTLGQVSQDVLTRVKILRATQENCKFFLIFIFIPKDVTRLSTKSGTKLRFSPTPWPVWTLIYFILTYTIILYYFLSPFLFRYRSCGFAFFGKCYPCASPNGPTEPTYYYTAIHAPENGSYRC